MSDVDRQAGAVIEALAETWRTAEAKRHPNVTGLNPDDATFLAVLWNLRELTSGLGDAEGVRRLDEVLELAAHVADQR